MSFSHSFNQLGVRKNSSHHHQVEAGAGAAALAISKSPIAKIVRVADNAVPIIFLVSEATDLYAWHENVISGEKALTNLGFGVIGFSKFGAMISAGYFAIDAFSPGGWNAVGNDISSGWNQFVGGINNLNNSSFGDLINN